MADALPTTATPAALRPLRRRFDAEARAAYTMLAPVIVLFAVFQYYPILKSLVLSFFEYGLLRRTTPFVGLANYTRSFQDPLFLSALGNTLVFVAGTVVVGVVLALALAVLVERTGRWAHLYRTLYFIPVVTSLMASAMVWRWLYASNGLFNFVLGLVGVGPQPWLLGEGLALASLMGLTVWKSLGFDLVLFSAALQGIPEDLYEAAHLDGASRWQDFWHITLPQLRPIVLLVCVTAVIRSFQVFTIILAMTQGGPVNATRSLVYHLYEQGIQYDEMGYASAAAVVLLVLIGGVTFAQMRLAKRFA